MLPFAAAALLLSGCTHYYYSPNNLNIPILQKQHDASISIGRYRGGEIRGMEVQAIYSPLKYTGVMFNHVKIPRNQNGDSSHDAEWGRGRLTEGGIGGYWPHYPFTLSLFGGYGSGWVENSYEHLDRGITLPGSLSARLEFRRWFVQPSVGFRLKWFRVGVGMRRVFLNYIQGDIDYLIDPMELASVRNIEAKGRFKFWETGFSIGCYFNEGSLTFNKVSLHSRRDKLEADFQFNSYAWNLALSLNIHEIWRKEDE